MGIGWPQLLVVAVLVLVLFGRGRISEMMGDFGKGISSFKKGMNEEDKPSPTPASAQIEAPAPTPSPAPTPAPAATETGDSVNSGDKTAG